MIPSEPIHLTHYEESFGSEPKDKIRFFFLFTLVKTNGSCRELSLPLLTTNHISFNQLLSSVFIALS